MMKSARRRASRWSLSRVTENQKPLEGFKPQGPRIEGGIDAIVIGSASDAIAASALLARAGLHVVLIETGAGRPGERREFVPGFFADSGDPFAACLDEAVIDALDLYRHGLSFAARRIATAVKFADGSFMEIGGDLALAGEAAALLSPEDAPAFGAFIDEKLKRARLLADWFEGGPLPDEPSLRTLSRASLDSAVIGRFADARLEDFLRAEAAWGASARPSEPFTFLALLRRFAGVAAGLQGAVALIAGGGRALNSALRRAAQAAGVSIRQTDRVTKVIVEWDRVAGVAFDDGAQIRAPIIVSGLSARETFIDFIGRERLDIEFTRALDLQRKAPASVRFNLALNAGPKDADVAPDLGRRFLYAPNPLDVEHAFRAARAGAAPASPIAELVFPSVFDKSLAPDGAATASLALHPIADRRDDDFDAALSETARAAFERIAGATEIAAIDIESIEAAPPPVAEAIDRRSLLTGAGGLEGYFFCGPETNAGGRLTLSAGRRAAERARDYFRKGGGD